MRKGIFSAISIEKDVMLLLLLLSRFSRVRLCASPETAAHQAPPSLGFSRQEPWSGLPFPSPMHESETWKWSRSVVSDSSRPHGLQHTRLLRPWDSPGKSSGVVAIAFSWRMSWSSELQPSSVSWWALRELRKEENSCHLAAIRCQPLPRLSPKEAQDVKYIGCPPQIAEVHIKGIIPVSPDSCIFPYIESAKFLNLGCLGLSLINSTLLMFRLPALCCRTSIWSDSSPRLLRAILSGCLRCCLPGLKP